MVWCNLRIPMPFPPEERKALLGVKGVGPTVVARLEQMGFDSIPKSSDHFVGFACRAQALSALGLRVLD